MSETLRLLFFALIFRPFVLLWIGLNTRGRENLPLRGPAIIVANHNSHLDTLALLSLYPLARLNQVRPAAAVDYFLSNRYLGWFATRIIGIIPVARGAAGGDPLAGCVEALARGEILILFPEGSRGQPERISQFKRGVALLVKQRSDVPVVPVYLRGFGRVLPKGSWLPVPLFCDVFIGPPLDRPAGLANKEQMIEFVAAMERRFEDMAASEPGAVWE